MTAVDDRPAILDALVARSRDLVPALRERARRTEELRRVPDETIADFAAAGLFRVFQPRRYGGYELDYGPTQLAISAELGRGCGSSAWVQSVVACHAWILGMYDQQAQADVWGDAPEALLASAFSANRVTLTPVEGGYRLSGSWSFSSGVDPCQWALLSAPLLRPDRPPTPLFCLVPHADYTIDDTWFAIGLRGTGSKDVLVEDAFVPAYRTVEYLALTGGPTPGSAVNPRHLYRLPLVGVFPYNLVAPAIGIARGALEMFAAEMSQRPDRAEQPARQLRVAEAGAEIDCAQTLLWRDAGEINALAEAGTPFTPMQLATYKRNLAYAGVLCMRAVDRLAAVLGAHGVHESHPVQRAFCDLHAINEHVGLMWDTNGLPYGRLMLGLDAGDPRLR